MQRDPKANWELCRFTVKTNRQRKTFWFFSTMTYWWLVTGCVFTHGIITVHIFVAFCACCSLQPVVCRPTFIFRCVEWFSFCSSVNEWAIYCTEILQFRLEDIKRRYGPDFVSFAEVSSWSRTNATTAIRSEKWPILRRNCETSCAAFCADVRNSWVLIEYKFCSPFCPPPVVPLHMLCPRTTLGKDQFRVTWQLLPPGLQ